MVRSQIISKLSNREHQKLKKSDLKKILQIFLNTIVEGIKKNKSSEFRGFGTFSVKILKAKKNARNPRTGEQIQIAASQKVKFLPAKGLKDMFNR